MRETILETFSNSSMKENADCSVHILALGVLISHRCSPFLILKYIIFTVIRRKGIARLLLKQILCQTHHPIIVEVQVLNRKGRVSKKIFVP